MYERILVATDGSQSAARAIDHAIELARGLEATLFGVAVVESRTAYDNEIVDQSVVNARLRERAAERVERLAERARDVDVPAETTVRSGVPHEVLLDVVDEHDVDLIVVGARGRSGFRGALLGSTVDAIVRLSPVPVLVVDGGGEVDEHDDVR